MSDTPKDPESEAAPQGAEAAVAGADVFPEMEEGGAVAAPAGAELMTGEAGATDAGGRNIDAMLNVGLNVQIVLGQTRMPIAQLLRFSRGSIIELEKKIGEPVDVVINDRLVARGDLIKLENERLGVSLTEIVKDFVTET